MGDGFGSSCRTVSIAALFRNEFIAPSAVDATAAA
jgi:hypothetical protein